MFFVPKDRFSKQNDPNHFLFLQDHCRKGFEDIPGAEAVAEGPAEGLGASVK